MLNPKQIVSVQLRRRVTFLDPSVARSKRRGAKKTTSFEMDVSTISWYNHRRSEGLIEGELHVHKELPASSSHPSFSVEVCGFVSSALPCLTSTIVVLDRCIAGVQSGFCPDRWNPTVGRSASRRRHGVCGGATPTSRHPCACTIVD